jgi:hypothetical protein
MKEQQQQAPRVARDLFALFPTSLHHHITNNRNIQLAV